MKPHKSIFRQGPLFLLVLLSAASWAGAAQGSPRSFTNEFGMTFVHIQAGSFTMGSPEDESERGLDETRHTVILTRSFYMQATEVTQAQWTAVMGENPSRFTNCGDDCPVESVSWEMAREFARKLSSLDPERDYRLPYEAEWEYACRAGTQTVFSTGDCLDTEQANFNGNYIFSGCTKGVYRETPVPVGSFPPNAWGLYDMHGNVGEWCRDRYGEYPQGTVTDPKGPGIGTFRVFRGGSWYANPATCRSANREAGNTHGQYHSKGLRLVSD